MKLTNKLITFDIDVAEDQNIFGFKIFNSANSKQYLKAVKLLENANAEITTSDGTYEYSSQLFTITTVSNSDIKVLSKFFDIDFNDSESNSIGFFPNAIEDAYDLGLINEDEEEQEEYDDYEEEDY